MACLQSQGVGKGWHGGWRIAAGFDGPKENVDQASYVAQPRAGCNIWKDLLIRGFGMSLGKILSLIEAHSPIR